MHNQGVSLSMIKVLCSKSSITADTAFRKDLTLQGCAKYHHTLDQPRKARK